MKEALQIMRLGHDGLNPPYTIMKSVVDMIIVGIATYAQVKGILSMEITRKHQRIVAIWQR